VRLAYLGTPELAVPPLRALVAAGHEIVLVVTRPDRRRGRGGATSPSPVKAAALDLDLQVSHVLDDVVSAGAELGVVVAYGRIIPPPVLAALPMVNLHFSKLPRWRGAAPVERALLAGDTETAVDVMAVEEGLDTGAIFARRTVPIGPRTTLEQLRAELVTVGTDLLVDTLGGPLPTPVAQTGDVTVAAKIDAAELQLDWARPAVELDRWVRVGGAWTTWRGRRLKVLASEPVAPTDASDVVPGTLVDIDGHVATGAGVLLLQRVQPEGKAAMAWREFANGARPTSGEVLGQ
jgi:methionyl-tRNA formyltransferase